MLFTTTHPITRTMAADIVDAVHQYDPEAIVRAEFAGQNVLIDGDITVAQARAALVQAQCGPVELKDAGVPLHIQGGNTCCGQCS
ncbi:MAG: hypothetical protein E6Q43_05370 [Dokdonella sp.]|nr:MAG: hypothetical protein EYC71_14320 [Gammaproteobacteria bacterium]TXI73478.1 MAG: hypothetical protein E6Q43_05370 [Dokdonella sp.]